MHPSRRAIAIGTPLACALLVVLGASRTVAQTTERVSVSSSGAQGNAYSSTPAFSRDGGFVAFQSFAGNLVPGDTNAATDVFVHGRSSKQTVRVSVNSGGQQGDKHSTMPSISADGRFVAFQSKATNLVPDDTNNADDIFVHDVLTGETTRVSVSSAGAEGNAGSAAPMITSDGRYVVFASAASNLVPGDTNGQADVFVHDRQTGTTTRVSLHSNGGEGNGPSYWAAISDDGRYVAFRTQATNLIDNDANGPLADVLHHDRATGQTILAHLSSEGIQGNNECLLQRPAISGDGLLVGFASHATNLVPGDTNAKADVFVRNTVTRQTVRVSVDSAGVQGNDTSELPFFSATGRYITFISYASNLVPGDTNLRADVFLHDLTTGSVRRVSYGANGEQGNDHCRYNPAPVLPDGDEVAFNSDASNLVPDDTNNATDVFVRVLGDCIPPGIVTHPESQAVCEGVRVEFVAVAEGTPPPTYQWRKDGVDIPGATEAVYVIAQAARDDSGVYDVVVTNPCGKVTSKPATLIVGNTILEHPQSQTTCEGYGVSFTVKARTPPPTTYQWRKNGQDIPGATSDVLSFPSVLPKDAGDYDVVVTSPCGSLPSDIAKLVVNQPPRIVTQPQPQNICVGGRAEFKVVAEGGEPLSYQWCKNGEKIPGATKDTYIIDPVTEQDAGTYHVQIQNACGYVASDFAKLAVWHGPTIAKHPEDASVCQGEAVQFSVTAVGDGTLRYQWRKDGVDLPNANQSTYVIDPVTREHAGQYDVVVSNACGAVTSNAATLTVSEDVTPKITQQPKDQTACPGGRAEFTVVAEGTALQYQWQKFDMKLQRWVDIPGATQPTLVVDPVTQDDRTNYHVIVSNACRAVRSNDAFLAIDFGVITIVKHPEDQTVCEGGRATFRVTLDAVPPISYQWRKDGRDIPGATQNPFVIDPASQNDAGLYDVVVRTKCGGPVTSNAALLTVVQGSGPTIVVQPSDQTGCTGHPVEFRVQATGNPPLAYQWRKFEVPIGGAVSETLTIDPVERQHAGVYDVIVSDPCGSVLSDPAELGVNRSPEILVNPADRVVAEGEGVTFWVDARGTSPLEYQWRKDGAPIPGANAATFTIEVVKGEHVGRYDVVVRNACDEVTSTAAQLTVVKPPRTTRVSLSTGGAEANDHSHDCSISSDGQVVTFASRAFKLAPGFAVNAEQIFLRHRRSGQTRILTANPYGWQADGDSYRAVQSEDWRWIVIESDASNIVAGDTNEKRDLFLIRNSTGRTTRISLGLLGTESDGDSFGAEIAPDGRYIVFASDATNLVVGDTNQATDVFVYERLTDQITRVSVNSAGGQGNAGSYSPGLTADGQRVVFASAASNLVAGDTNNAADVFLRDLTSGQTWRVSVASDGREGNSDSDSASISSDGRHIVFRSEANNLVPNDKNDHSDIFSRDLLAQKTVVLSTNTADEFGNDDSWSPSASGTGRLVAFASAAGNLDELDVNQKVDVFLRDRDPDGNGIFDEGNATLIRATRPHWQYAEPNGNSDAPRVAADGFYLVYESYASNLVNGDTNGQCDVFLFYVGAPSIRRVSVTRDPTEGDAPSVRPTICGGTVFFSSGASTFFLEDRNEVYDIFSSDVSADDLSIKLHTRGWVANAISVDAAVSPEGRWVVFASDADNLVGDDRNLRRDVFIVDVATGRIERVSENAQGEPADNNSTEPRPSRDGQFVAFASAATNLVPDDTNNAGDVFVRDTRTGAVERVSVASAGQQANGDSDTPAISADGRFVAFRSWATNLVSADTNGVPDIFVHDRQHETTIRVSVDSAGKQANNESLHPSISGDGGLVAFTSPATNLVPNDTNGCADVFVHDCQTRTTRRVSVGSQGQQADGPSGNAVLSENGQLVAFTSGAANLVSDDTNQAVDVFVHDLATGQTRRVSLNSLGAQGNRDSQLPVISSDGGFVAFESDATNLVPYDQNNYRDIFVHDRRGCLEPIILTPPKDLNVCQGQRIELRVVGAGTPPLLYQWRKDGLDLPGATRDLLIIESAGEIHAGQYTVVVRNDCGALESPPAHVRVERCEAFTDIVSVNAPGAELNQDSSAPSLSADGRHVTFHTKATNVVPGEQWDYLDVFVHDRARNRAFCMSRAMDGSPGKGDSYSPCASANGRWVVFTSQAPNLVPDDTNNDRDVFVRDRDPDGNGIYDEGNEVTRCVTLKWNSPETAGGGELLGQVISANGKYVAFSSSSSLLMPDGGGGIQHIYVRDLETNQIERVSVNSAGQWGNAMSLQPSVSPEGRYVVFTSAATNLDPRDPTQNQDIFLHDRQTHQTELVSLSLSNQAGNNTSRSATVSDDGRFIAFVSQASDLVPDDTNGADDVFVRDRQEQRTVRVSIGPGGLEANGASFRPAISSAGRRVVFYSAASNLVPDDNNLVSDAFAHDLDTHTTMLLSARPDGRPGNGPCGQSGEVRDGIWIAPDGQAAVFYSAASDLVPDDTNGRHDLFWRDLPKSATQRVSLSGGGVAGDGIDGSTSADGRLLVFTSASALVPGDTNRVIDVFVYDRETRQTVRASVSSQGDQGNERSGEAAISPNGRHVAFFSAASNLVPNDTNWRDDVFVRDLTAGTTVRVSVSTSGEQGNGNSRGVAISETGRLVAFASYATNLVPGDTNAVQDVFVHDRDPDENGIFDEGNGITTRVSVDSSGYQGSQWSAWPSLSDSGRFVSFMSAAKLVPEDQNNRNDIYVHDRVTARTERVSVSSQGAEGNDHSEDASLSGNGRYVAFVSAASNLVPNDTNNATDIFLHDRVERRTERVSVDSAGNQGNGYSGNDRWAPRISVLGRYVVFGSSATNLVPNDTNGRGDVFLRDRMRGLTQRMSVASGGQQADRGGGKPAIVADGRVVTFESDSTNLLPYPIVAMTALYVRDERPLLGPDQPRKCDSNCDGVVDNFDIDPFIAALVDPRRYELEYPYCSLLGNNDINGDGVVNNFDIDPFVDCLTGR